MVLEKVRFPRLEGREGDTIQNLLKPFCAISLKAWYRTNLGSPDGQQGTRKLKKKNFRYSLISHLVGVTLDRESASQSPYRRIRRVSRRGWHLPLFFVGSAFMDYRCYVLAQKTSNHTQELSCCLNISSHMTFRKSVSKIKQNVTFGEYFIELHLPVPSWLLQLQDSGFESFYLNPHRQKLTFKKKVFPDS